MRRAWLVAVAVAGAALLAGGAAPARAQDAEAPADSAIAAPVAPEDPAAPATSTRGPRIPGTSLRLGDSVAIVRGRPDLRAVPDPDLGPGEVAYGGTVRFYGAPGNAKLVFREGALARATFELRRASPRTRAYVEDDLRRLGFRADCRPARTDDRDCDWSGPLSATVRADSAKLTADFGATGATRSETAGETRAVRVEARSLQAALAADSTPILPDTLDINEDNPSGYPRPVIGKRAPARIPDEMRGSVERGSVVVLAFVSAEGQVLYVKAVEGPEALRPVVEAVVLQYRFMRYQTKEGRRRYWVRLSVYPA